MASMYEKSCFAARQTARWLLTLSIAVFAAAACAPSNTTPAPAPGDGTEVDGAPPADGAMTADSRVGLGAGLRDAEQAISNMRVLSETPPPEGFEDFTNSDLAFKGQYAIQGNYNGILIWDISNPRDPALVTGYVCPASQNDVSVYQNLLFVSAEARNGRLDCGTEGIEEDVSDMRIRGIRIFDISDIRNPEYVGNVQTCRGSHTHTVLADPDDQENVYVYVSGSSFVRPAEELAGCVSESPEEDQESSLFQIDVIRVPLDNPEAGAIVTSPEIFEDLVEAPTHGPAPEDVERAAQRAAEARAQGAFTAEIMGIERVAPPQFINPLLDSIVAARGGEGPPTAADSAALRDALPDIVARMFGEDEDSPGPEPGPDQCHDITVYPALDLAGGACEGYGLLLDISDPTDPVRIDAVADSNFAYWHSATFNNEGTAVVFTDEWGGGGGAKCRATDRPEWGANAIFTIDGREMEFQSYYKMPAAQTEQENCVAHNGSLIPIPGRDVMVQAWYQGGISVFDFTDPENPFEIAYFDRGPVDAARMASGGAWSSYWYNGDIISSEIARGLDILRLTPSEYVSRNELDAARTVEMNYLNVQGQPRFDWPPSFALARAYLDQLERSNGLDAVVIAEAREELAQAEEGSANVQREELNDLAGELSQYASGARDTEKVRTLITAIRDLADVTS